MNNDILKLYENFKEETTEIREERKEFERRRTLNNNIMYYEIYQYLIDALKENPVKDYYLLCYPIELKPLSYLTDPLEKKMVGINPSSNYAIYKRRNTKEEILVNIETIHTKLKDDGFPYDSLKKEEKKKRDDVQKITIEIMAYKFREILDNFLELKEKREDREKKEQEVDKERTSGKRKTKK